MNSSNDHLLFTKELAPPDLEYTITCIYVLVLNYRDAFLYILYCYMCMYVHSCADLKGGGSRPPPPWNLQSLISPILLEMKKLNQLFFIFVHFHSYTSRLNPPSSPQNILPPRLTLYMYHTATLFLNEADLQACVPLYKTEQIVYALSK